MDLRDLFHMVFGTSLSQNGACRGLCRSLALILAFDCAANLCVITTPAPNVQTLLQIPALASGQSRVLSITPPRHPGEPTGHVGDVLARLLPVCPR